MKEMKRVLALVLCFVMLVGVMPVGALAAEAETTAPSVTEEILATEAAAAAAETEAAEIETTSATEAVVLTASEDAYTAQVDGFMDAAIFCSDVHGSTSDLSAVLGGVAKSNVDYSSIGFVGDTCLTVANTTSTVTSALGYTPEVVYSYAASHDDEDGADIGDKWDFSGEAYENDNYIVYTIRETDMQTVSAAATAAAEFAAWAETADKTKPLFIMTHRPMHKRRSECEGGNEWYKVIQPVADEMDVVVFWGHNHTGEDDVDRAAYYVAKDGTETMTITNGDTVVPNFTYMNAGYINANNQNPSRLGIATTVQITDDSLVFQDYNSSGEYTGTYAHNVTVAREFAEEVEEETTTPESSEATDPTDSTEATDPVVAPAYIELAGTGAYTVGDDLTVTVKAYYAPDYSPVEVALADCDITLACSGHEVCTLDTVMNTVATGEDNDYHQIVVSYQGSPTQAFTFSVGEAEDLTGNIAGVIVSVSSAVTGAITVAESANENVDAAMEAAAVTDYVAYDITPAYALKAGNYATVTLPIPEGVTNPVVYYVSDDGAIVTDMKATDNGDGTVSFVTTHFSTYIVGEVVGDIVIDTEGESAEVEGTEDVTTTQKVATPVTIYKLVSAPTSDKQYLIVNSNDGNGYGLDSDTTGYSVTAMTSADGYYTTWDEATETGTAFSIGSDVYIAANSNAYLWTAGINTFSIGYTQESSGNVLSGGTYSYTLNPSGSGDNWTLSDSKLVINLETSYSGIFGGSSASEDFYLANSGSNWSMGSTGTNVYFYEPVTVYTVTEAEVIVPGTEGGTYTATGDNITNAVAVDGRTVELTSTLTYTTTSGATSTPEGWTATYEVVTTKGTPAVIKSISGSTATLSGTAGTAVVKVTYTNGTLTVWDEFIVTATPPYYTIELHEIVDNPDTETGTELVLITAPVAVKGVEAGDTYSVWAVVKEYDGELDENGEDGEDLGELGDALTWSVSDTSIATIDTKTGVITFTGENYGTFQVTVAYVGADGKTITDTITISATESQYVVPGDGTDDFPEYPNEGAVRFDKTATAVGNYSETGIAMVELSMTGVPYTTGNEMDVVVMLDMSTSMDDTRIAATVAATQAFIDSIVKNEDGSYNGNRVYVGYFNGDTVYTITDSANIGGELASVDNDTEYNALIADIESEYDGSKTASGTNYDVSLEECYNVLNDVKTTEEGYDRSQFVVFMSDGGPTDYATSASNVISESTIVDYFEVGTAGSTTVDPEDYTNTVPDEYWSGLMKDNGVTIYSVGLILQEQPSSGPQTYRSYSDDQYYYITKTLLTGISSGEEYFFNCESSSDTAEMEGIFQDIALSIKEAATNVVVEDKVGEKYSLNFSIPGYGTNNAVSSEALDGLTEFYIQVVGYTLNSTTHEREGDPTVLENFTFNADGTLKSHTVGSAVCTDCSHVKTDDDGNIISIDGTYFDYLSDDTGEYLTWEAAKLDTTELALQYFAYLDNSTGLGDDETPIPAGTYYTNEYATLTYTNYNGKEVQQEFPIPQMTWNGAQVSYVFYLVNDAGQPVNRAGRVIPFAEAQYVTDVYTYSVLWNDLEQAAGLEAKYLAEQKVPGIYALYDDDAYYSIHVYEDENEVNLNNHFVIDGDVTDTESTSVGRTNANTTYVFNNKSDATKYNVPGTYVADDGDTDKNETGKSYYCKSETIEGATFETEIDAGGNTIYTVTSVGNGYQQVDGETQVSASDLKSTTGGTVINGYVYYVDENGAVYTIVEKSDASEVREGFDFSNTTVAFAVVWKPELVEDTVVVDYGLDVVVDVAENDVMAAGVTGVRTDAPALVDINNGHYTNNAKKTSVDVVMNNVTVGTATVENLKEIRFSMNKANSGGMQFSEPAVIYYEADCNYYTTDSADTQTLHTDTMYSSLTVIPATTVYYEDEYVTLKTFTKQEDGSYAETPGWDIDSTAAGSGRTQAVDRPGFTENMGDIEDWDANFVYGYDTAYGDCATYSMDNAAMINVVSGKYGTATFDFYGTGFDIISMTSNTTGSITVDIVGENATKYLFVDTYYGYTCQLANVTYVYTNNGWKYDSHVASETPGTGSYEDLDAWYDAFYKANGEEAKVALGTKATIHEPYWTKATNSGNALYQVPVIKASGLPYGKYTVTIQVSYSQYFDNTDAGNYDFYLDAIRIYDPTGVASGSTENSIVSDAYKADGEGWATYKELRDYLLTADSFGEEIDTNAGVIFIDQVSKDYDIVDYENYGPNNELYLEENQMVAFILDLSQYNGLVEDVQVGLKSANEALGEVYAELATYTENTVNNEDGTTTTTYTKNSSTARISAGTTATDRYYSIGSHVNKAGQTILSFKNTGDGILSITNIKLTFTANPNGTSTADFATFAMTRSVADGILMTLNAENEQAPVEPEEKLDAELNVSVNKSSVKEGGNVQVKVTTSSDVDSLTVNGREITEYKQNKKTGKRTWTVKVEAEEAGNLEIEVVAYSADGEALDSANETVQVTAKKNGNVNKTVGQLLGKLFG